MAKTKIEWCDWTCNCFWGCENGCPYCSARSMAKRFGKSIGTKRGYDTETVNRMAEFKPVFLSDQLLKIPNKPCRVFMSFMGDPFGSWNKPEWLEQAFSTMRKYPNHTFLMLTKQPQNLPREFPDNCWVGVSLTGKENPGFAYPLVHLEANVKFLSIEPLLAPIHFVNDGFTNSLKNAGIKWVIIGQQTPAKASTQPKIEWVKEIVEAADKASVPVFLKDNLKHIFVRDSSTQDEPFQKTFSWALSDWNKLRQEFPRG